MGHHRVYAAVRREFQSVLSAADPPLPRGGLTFRLPGAFRRARWYGRGPEENYPDRLDAAELGIHEGLVDCASGLRDGGGEAPSLDSAGLDALRRRALSSALNPDKEGVRSACDKLYEELRNSGVEVLYDDRGEKAGSMFSDADLLGIPLRLVVSPKTLADGEAEFRTRACRDTERVKLADAVAFIANRVAEEKKAYL